MSGIYGMVSTAGYPADETLLASMQAMMNHRNLTSLVTHHPHVTLGQITHKGDSSALLTNESQTILLAFEGCITNYRDLREDLLGLGHTFATRHPAETIVHLYEEKGADLLPFLRGPFALALWDTQARRLFLACDPIRSKPLTYYADDQRLIFASQSTALVADSSVPRHTVFQNPSVLAQALYKGSLPSPHTAFTEIPQIPSGYALIWSVDQPKPTLFCHWQPSALTPSRSKASIVEYEDDIREHLANSVRLHVASSDSVGVLLSGGMNSSLIAAMMQQQNRTLRTFTAHFDQQDTPETTRAAQVAAHLSAKHTSLSIPMPDLSRVLPPLVWHIGQPFITPQTLLMSLLSEVVQEPVDTLLTGAGGTILFGNPLPETQRPRFPIWHAATTFLQRGQVARQREAQREAEALTLFHPNTIEALVGVAPTVSFPPMSILQQMTELVSSLPDSHFIPMAQASDAQGFDLRFPFADPQVVESAAKIPLNLKHRLGQPLYVLHELAHGLLPSALLHVSLVPEKMPLDRWLRQQQGFVRETLLSQTASSPRLLRSSAMIPLIDAHMRGKDHSAALLALLTFTIWHRLFIEASSVTAP